MYGEDRTQVQRKGTSPFPYLDKKKKKTNFKAENKSLLCKDEDMQDEDMLTYKHVQLKKKEKGLTWMLHELEKKKTIIRYACVIYTV
jgi:hypothetical protein